MERAAARKGFTLLEILVVVAIIVMLAGLGGFYAMERLGDAKISMAQIKVKTISGYVEAYAVQNNDQRPQSLDALTQMQPTGGKPFALPEDLVDPWGQPFQYDPNGQRNGGIKGDVWTVGPSGVTYGNWPAGHN